MSRNLLVVCFYYAILVNLYTLALDEEWKGKFFPYSPNEPDTNPTVNPSLYDHKHGVAMGVSDPNCDDAKTNLTTDWGGSSENYTCFEDRKFYLPKSNIRPILSSEAIPVGYNAPHKCMFETIEYNSLIPTFGTHRPLWPKYGEYAFVPRQRWLHNLEHGAVVMLYHPCADGNDVNRLKSIVKSCLYRHIITPFNLLSKTRPLALVTWGYRLEMSKVSPEIVTDFIKKHALRGPEKTSKDGQYDHLLNEHAKIVANSDINDLNLCPNEKPYYN